MFAQAKEVKNSALETLKMRIGDPIIGSYFISFAFVNWKVIILLFSGLAPLDKINQIMGHLSPLLTQHPTFLDYISFFLFHPFILPFILSAVYLLLLPAIFRRANQLILDYKVQDANDRFKAEEKLSPIEQKISQLRDSLHIESQRTKDLSSLNSSLEKNIELLTSENNKFKSIQSEMSEKVKTSEAEIKKLKEELAAKTRTELIQVKNYEDIRDSNITKQAKEALNVLEEHDLAEEFKAMAKIICNSNLTVGTEEAIEFEDGIPLFNSLDLIERVESGVSPDYWILTDLGKKLIPHI